MPKKSWLEKYEECNAKGSVVKPVAKDMMGMKKGQAMLIANPKMLADVIREIPAGEVHDTTYLRSKLAEKAGAEITCPVTTGIFLRILAEAAHEDHEAGATISELTPFWRVLPEKAPLRKKVTFDLEPYLEQQALEQS